MFKRNYSLKSLTTIRLGGKAKYFIKAKTEKALIETIEWSKKSKIKYYLVGQSSNIVPADYGYNGLIVKNEISGFKREGSRIKVGSGYVLLDLINRLNTLGLQGMEKMAGIPGTIGGAIYGSAGAYGQEMKDNIVGVRIFDGKNTRVLSKRECYFGYRDSVFKKKKDWIILGVTLKLRKTNPKILKVISKEIIKLRSKKYPANLLCPGSFFKNIVVNDLPSVMRKKFLAKIPKEKINHGKVSAGYLLESVGAKNMKCGKIKVSDYHGNLIYNSGGGKTKDLIKLVRILKKRVKKKFCIDLSEEVQYI